MKAMSTRLPEVVIFDPNVFGDERGFFQETWNRRTFADLGYDLDFVQDNHSRSSRGVLRGLHYQRTRPQGKLVRVVRGSAFDVAVDLRRGSPHFGQWMGVVLSGENHRMLWVPPGFGHGFLSLEDGTDLLYKCTDFYVPEDEAAIRWDDQDIGIEWPLDDIEPTVSPKDRDAVRFRDAQTYP
ncbi:dTDP-4-dehydrorhamnose 3,5-epimerase [Croceicoccus bisphenolivorans]|uniref:dTDP-4-dehydrorhamnose 3,5-epimerase n=1 Tax=Croceicoccus bisphenolivorans TaxID=1783232 RepID=UPI00082A521D|nr:dTDP-4-dehydrorhamnose 3,5-epimerase [Croceicoccus bisphenolivorans]